MEVGSWLVNTRQPPLERESPHSGYRERHDVARPDFIHMKYSCNNVVIRSPSYPVNPSHPLEIISLTDVCSSSPFPSPVTRFQNSHSPTTLNPSPPRNLRPLLPSRSLSNPHPTHSILALAVPSRASKQTCRDPIPSAFQTTPQTSPFHPGHSSQSQLHPISITNHKTRIFPRSSVLLPSQSFVPPFNFS